MLASGLQLSGEISPEEKKWFTGKSEKPFSWQKKTHARTQGLKWREATSLFDECQQRRRVPLIRQQGAELGLSGLGISGGAAGCSLARLKLLFWTTSWLLGKSSTQRTVRAGQTWERGPRSSAFKQTKQKSIPAVKDSTYFQAESSGAPGKTWTSGVFGR